MVEPLQDIRNVTIEINVFAEEKYVERTRSQSWRTYSIPWPIKGSISFLNSRAFIQSCEPRVFLFPCTKPVVTNLKHLSICEIHAIHIDLLNSFFRDSWVAALKKKIGYHRTSIWSIDNWNIGIKLPSFLCNLDCNV